MLFCNGSNFTHKIGILLFLMYYNALSVINVNVAIKKKYIKK